MSDQRIAVGDVLSSLLLASVLFMVLVGNCLVVAAVSTSRKLRTVTNVFIVNLACADLLLGVFVLPFSAVLEVKDEWVFGNIWCQVWLAVDVWLCTASILNLCCISLDRYLAITRPIRYPSLMSARRAKTLVVCVWIFSFLICCPPLIGWNDNSDTSDALSIANTSSGRDTQERLEHEGFRGITIAPALLPAHKARIKVTSGATNTSPKTLEHLCITENSSHLLNISACQMQSENIFFLSTACELTNSRGYRIYAALGSFFIPMLVMVFFYLQIYRAAVKTIAAYEKGELKTKYGVREDSSGGRLNSVTLRIHRGGSSGTAVGKSNCSNRLQRGISYSNNAAIAASRNEEYRQSNGLEHGRSRVRETGSSTTTYNERAKYSDGSIVSLSELKSLDNNTSRRGRSKRNKHLVLCWKNGKRFEEAEMVETPICHNCGADLNQSNHGKRSVLRCMSNESADSSSGDSRKYLSGRAREHERASPQNSGVIMSSSSEQTFQSETSLRPSEKNGRIISRARFNTPRPASVLKIHMQKFNREKKAAKTLAIIVGAFIMCWMPFFTIYLVGAFCESCIPPAVFSVTFWLGYCNSAMNPCVYGLFSKDFRFAFRKLLTCRYRLLRNYRPRLQKQGANGRVPAIQLHLHPQEEAKSSSDVENQST
ncbi:octopamine receptor 1 [Plakobranchus ocellatus]|uniref:Octopamine receptor 1 n=1 Tax=Plakobranchus ocellatus TaxID=259542 RepID=A0AAV4A5U3_9GAST|nr:octopamine receptor 1 [Plakobranchus ocellatus]